MANSLRVLIIEDSDIDAFFLLRTLRHAGYEVTYQIVQTEDAMRVALECRDWNLITADHSMPSFNAVEALKLAKQLRPSVPFVVVSDETDFDVAGSLIEAGARDYIPKDKLVRLVPTVKAICTWPTSHTASEATTPGR